MDIFDDRQTTLDLNGPTLSFTTSPSNVSICDTTSTTLIGIATATFPDQTPGTNTGTISYQWYVEGYGALSNGDIAGLGFTGISGAATTTLSFYGNSPQANSQKIFLRSDYQPSAYGTDPITAGTARSTGNAVNDTYDTDSITLTVYPSIGISSQPATTEQPTLGAVDFHVDTSITDTTQGGLTYQWLLNGEEVSDGTKTTTSTTSTVTPTQQVIGPFGTGSHNYSIPSSATDIFITAAGAKGGKGGNDAGGNGTPGGAGRAGTFAIDAGDVAGKTVNFYVGREGNNGTEGKRQSWGSGGSTTVAGATGSGARGGGAGQHGWSGGGGGGGAATRVFVGANIFIVAGGGGGGGGGSNNRHATGTYPAGPFQEEYGPYPNPGLPIRNGAQGHDKEGDGGGGGGGGGGVTGGAGGGSGTDNHQGGVGGKGGSSGANTNIATIQSPSHGWLNWSSGYGSLKYTSVATSSETTTTKTTVSGSQTNKLTLAADKVGIQTVQCKITHPTACQSPIYTDVGELVTTLDQVGLVQWDVVDENGNHYGDGEQKIGENPLTFRSTGGTWTHLYSVHAPDEDLVVKVTMAASSGRDYTNTPSNQAGRWGGPWKGGQGGYSTILLTMKKDTEYIFSLGYRTNPSGGRNGGGGGVFLYEQGTLLCCVGGGGGAGMGSDGGDGGGVDVGGKNGLGAAGGRRYAPGTLPLQGYYEGGQWAIRTEPPQGQQGGSPGRVDACTTGNYWTQFSPCASMGVKRWYGQNGVQDYESASIVRGFKAGENHRANGGSGEKVSNGQNGGGGSGAEGGQSGEWGNATGGGGGSGYTNGQVTILDTRAGGHVGDGESYVTLEIV